MQTCSSHVHTGHVHALYIYDVYTCVSMCMYSASTGIAAYMNVTSDLCTQCGCAYIYVFVTVGVNLHMHVCVCVMGDKGK